MKWPVAEAPFNSIIFYRALAATSYRNACDEWNLAFLQGVMKIRFSDFTFEKMRYIMWKIQNIKVSSQKCHMATTKTNGHYDRYLKICIFSIIPFSMVASHY